MRKNVLFTGKPGIGKTTVIKKFISGLASPGGFYSEEIRAGGERQGFKILTLDGKEGILAHRNIKSPYRVSKYGVNIKDLEEIAGKSIEEAIENGKTSMVIIDEIGRMELYSRRFQEIVLRALDSPKPVIGVIQNRDSPFINKIKSRRDVEMVEVTVDNRNGLANQILKKIKKFRSRRVGC